MVSLFPEDENSVFINISDIIIKEIDANKSYDIHCIFYTIQSNMKYPYACFLFESKNSQLDFFKIKVKDVNEIDIFLENLQINLENFLIYHSKIKYYFDTKMNKIYLFCEFRASLRKYILLTPGIATGY